MYFLVVEMHKIMYWSWHRSFYFVNLNLFSPTLESITDALFGPKLGCELLQALSYTNTEVG